MGFGFLVFMGRGWFWRWLGTGRYFVLFGGSLGAMWVDRYLGIYLEEGSTKRYGKEKEENCIVPKCGGGFQIRLLWFGNWVSWGWHVCMHRGI